MGVMTVAATVLAAVMSTDRATSPCATNVATLLAWPPATPPVDIQWWKDGIDALEPGWAMAAAALLGTVPCLQQHGRSIRSALVSGWLTGAAAEQDEPGGKGGGQGHELGDDDGKDGQYGVLTHKAQQDGHRVGGALHSVVAGPGAKARGRAGQAG